MVRWVTKPATHTAGSWRAATATTAEVTSRQPWLVCLSKSEEEDGEDILGGAVTRRNSTAAGKATKETAAALERHPRLKHRRLRAPMPIAYSWASIESTWASDTACHDDFDEGEAVKGVEDSKEGAEANREKKADSCK